jgi:hypothetical protein
LIEKCIDRSHDVGDLIIADAFNRTA